MSEDSTNMLAAFEFVGDAYRTASRMLLAADAILTDRRFAAYHRWDAIWPTRTTNLSKMDWLPTSVFRQYHSPEQKDREVVTLACVFYANDDRRIAEPLCVGSHLYVNSVAENDVYWWAIVQRWALDKAPADGAVRVLVAEDVGFSSAKEKGNFLAGVVGARLATVAVPLLDIHATSDVERKIVDPLLAANFGPPALLATPDAAASATGTSLV